MLCEASSGKHKTTSCRRAATVRVSLANQATVLVTGCRSQSALGGSSVAAGHIAWASALAGALGTAEVARNAADANGDLIGLAATRRVAIMGGVGRHGHLPHSEKACCQHSLLWAKILHTRSARFLKHPTSTTSPPGSSRPEGPSRMTHRYTGRCPSSFGSFPCLKALSPCYVKLAAANVKQLLAGVLPQSESAWQIRPQYLSPVVVRRAHSGVAVSPLGTSLGQVPWLVHLGLQKSPEMPLTRTATSSDSQPLEGLP